MKKKLFLLIIFISVFAFQKNTVAQTIRLDSIIGFPDTVTDFQAVNMDLLISNSGGILFSGDLIVFFHSLGDTSGPDTLYYNQNYTLSGNTFYDTVHISHTFTAAELDGGDNIVVVWPASSQMPLQVSGDSITDTIYFNNVGISENKSLQAIRLFPNPSNEKIGFLMANPEKGEQEIGRAHV